MTEFIIAIVLGLGLDITSIFLINRQVGKLIAADSFSSGFLAFILLAVFAIGTRLFSLTFKLMAAKNIDEKSRPKGLLAIFYSWAVLMNVGSWMLVLNQIANRQGLVLLLILVVMTLFYLVMLLLDIFSIAARNKEFPDADPVYDTSSYSTYKPEKESFWDRALERMERRRKEEEEYRRECEIRDYERENKTTWYRMKHPCECYGE